MMTTKMKYNEKLHGKLAERKKNSGQVTERELEINGEEVIFIGNGVEVVKIEEGVIEIEPSAAGGTIFISKNVVWTFEVRIANDNLWLRSEDYSLEMEDSIEKGRVIKYQIDDEEMDKEMDEEMDLEEILLYNEEDREEQKVKEISVNKNGEYQFGKGKLKIEDNGYKIILNMEYNKLVIEGFGQERRLKYLETKENNANDDSNFIIDIKSQKEINATIRNEILGEFQKIADDINGDKHGLAKGIRRILNDNNVSVVYQ